MESGELALSDREFARIKRRVYDVAGISLSDAKRTLVISRLTKIVRSLGLPSFDAYADFLESSARPADNETFVNALTTNLTRFYREDHHFAHLCEHIPHVMAQRAREGGDGARRLRIWSAGCSTGQEPYTIAMSLLAAIPELKRWDLRILATDIDTAVLAKAAQGIYPASELQGLSPQRAAQLETLPDGTIRVPDAVRSLISFKPLNLMHDWPMRGPFDAIFCRNVAIYFDRPTQSTLFSRLGGKLADGCFLYIGHSESIGNDPGNFKLVGKTIYQMRAAAQRSAA